MLAHFFDICKFFFVDRWLRLKLHGVLVPPDQDAGIANYLTVHQQILAEEGLGQAWLGVCMAMLTAPEFMTY